MKGLLVICVAALAVSMVSAKWKWGQWSAPHSSDGHIEKLNSRPLPGSCGSDADCGDEECCVFENLPARHWKNHLERPGSCQPNRAEGDVCYPSRPVTRFSDTRYRVCPCASGLTCQGDQPTCQSVSEGSGDAN